MLWDPKWQARVTPAVRLLEVWREKYLAAAGEIERNGWCQGRLGEAGRPRCLIGALLAAGVTDEEARHLIGYLGVSPCHFGYLSLWNDDKRRTKEQVVFALRDCAMSWE